MDKKSLQQYIDNPDRYCNTPDDIDFGGYFDFTDKNAYPFSYVILPGENEPQLLFGEPGTAHDKIRDKIVNSFRKKTNNNFTALDKLFGGYMRKEYVGQMKRPKADPAECVERAIKYGGREYLDHHEQNGRYFLITKDNTNVCIFTFWNVWRCGDDDNEFLEPNSPDITKLVKLIMEQDQRIGQCDLILIANNEEPYYVYKEDTPDDFFKIGDNSTQRAIHLANQQQKRDFFADFRNNRDRLIGQKLTMSNGKEMPVAQWNALRRVDEDLLKIKQIIREAVFETADGFTNANGKNFTNRGDGWPFIIFNGKIYGLREPNAHNDLLMNILSEFGYGEEFENLAKTERQKTTKAGKPISNRTVRRNAFEILTERHPEFEFINNRCISITGRVFVGAGVNGDSVIKFYDPSKNKRDVYNNIEKHNLRGNNDKIAALVKLVADHFGLDINRVRYIDGDADNYELKPNHIATDAEVQELLDGTKRKFNAAYQMKMDKINNERRNYAGQGQRELSHQEILNKWKDFDDSNNDVEYNYYNGYANGRYSDLTQTEREYFKNLRYREPRGNKAVLDHLTSVNPHFTQAQWNAMSTIGDSKISNKKVIKESQLKEIIREILEKCLN